MGDRHNLAAARWRKSSHSGSSSGDCVEVADGFPGVMPVRDSKDPHGPALLIPAPAWQAFIAAIRAGDLPADC